MSVLAQVLFEVRAKFSVTISWQSRKVFGNQLTNYMKNNTVVCCRHDQNAQCGLVRLFMFRARWPFLSWRASLLA
jgi:hypothetical protein